MTGIIGLLTLITWIVVWILKRIDARKNPNETSKKDIAKMDDALVHGDADRVALNFDELFQDADRYDSGQHEAEKTAGRDLEGD